MRLDVISRWVVHGRVVAGLLFTCTLLLTLTHGQPAIGSLPAAEQKWRYLTSPNFELYSRQKDSASKVLLENLETLRAVFIEQLKFKPRRRLDVTVFYFSNHKEFEAYIPESLRGNDNLAAFYCPNEDRAMIVMGPSTDWEAAQRTTFHEYIHHLFRLAEIDPPLWFNEGTAEVLAGMKIERKRVYIGTPLENSVLYLRSELLLPLEQLFAADHGSSLYTSAEHSGVFYAQSWALLHYLQFGNSGFSREAVDRFLRVAGNRQAAAATDLRQHFQSCFGCDYRQMQSQLAGYVRTGSYRAGAVPKPAVPASSTYGVRGVASDEILCRLAELSVRTTKSAIGKYLLLNLLNARADDPRPLEALGALAAMEGEHRVAEEYWEKALASGSGNPAIVRELALREGRRWFANYDPDFTMPGELVEKMRRRLLHSIATEPEQAAAYEMLLWVESFSAEPSVENINRVIARLPTLPDARRTLVALARCVLRAGKPEEAATVLDRLHDFQLQRQDSYAVESLEAELARDFPQFARNRRSTGGKNG